MIDSAFINKVFPENSVPLEGEYLLATDTLDSSNMGVNDRAGVWDADANLVNFPAEITATGTVGWYKYFGKTSDNGEVQIMVSEGATRRFFSASRVAGALGPWSQVAGTDTAVTRQYYDAPTQGQANFIVTQPLPTDLDTVHVFRNGVLQRPGATNDFVFTANGFTLNDAIDNGGSQEVVQIWWGIATGTADLSNYIQTTDYPNFGPHIYYVTRFGGSDATGEPGSKLNTYATPWGAAALAAAQYQLDGIRKLIEVDPGQWDVPVVGFENTYWDGVDFNYNLTEITNTTANRYWQGRIEYTDNHKGTSNIYGSLRYTTTNQIGFVLNDETARCTLEAESITATGTANGLAVAFNKFKNMNLRVKKITTVNSGGLNLYFDNANHSAADPAILNVEVDTLITNEENTAHAAFVGCYVEGANIKANINVKNAFCNNAHASGGLLRARNLQSGSQVTANFNSVKMNLAAAFANPQNVFAIGVEGNAAGSKVSVKINNQDANVSTLVQVSQQGELFLDVNGTDGGNNITLGNCSGLRLSGNLVCDRDNAQGFQLSTFAGLPATHMGVIRNFDYQLTGVGDQMFSTNVTNVPVIVIQPATTNVNNIGTRADQQNSVFITGLTT